MMDLLKRPIAFHPALARLFGGIPEAIYWQQLYYWSDKGGRSDGFIYKTKDEIEEETTLTREQQDRVRKKLESLGYIETKLHKANGHPTVHYKVNSPLVRKTLMEKCETHYSEKRETHECITESTQRVTPAEQSSEIYQIVPDVEEDRKPKKPNKMTPEVKEVFALFGKDCFDLVGVRPLEREAAIFLLEKFGIKKLRSAKEFIEEQNDGDFAYKVLTPYDLRIKWLGLKNKKDKS